MDPDVRKYFKRILNSFMIGFLWMFTISTLGLYFKLALFDHTVRWYNILFYSLFVVSFLALLWYYYKSWK
jgi:hypothetical protein